MSNSARLPGGSGRGPRSLTLEHAAPPGWDDLVMVDTDALPPHELYQSSPWLRTASVFGDEPLELLVASDGDRPVGGLLTRRVGPGTRDSRIALDDALEDADLPARLVGGLYDGRSGPLVAPDLDLGDRRDVVGQLVGAAEARAAESGERSVVLRSVDAEDVVLRDLLRERGYAEHDGPAHLVLAPPPGGFEGYLASLTGRYRNMVRRERRKVRDAGIEVTVEPLSRELVATVAPLVVNLALRYGVDDDETRAAARTKMLRRALGADVEVVLARRDGVVVGVVELMWHRGHAWCGYAGFDYEAQGDLPVYFEVLFYGLIEAVADRSPGTVDYTTSTEAAKTARGCAARPTVRLVKRLPV